MVVTAGIGRGRGASSPGCGESARRFPYPSVMAAHLQRDLDLEEVVERARGQAERTGELLAAPSGRISGTMDPDARAALARWEASGAHKHALDAVMADDPDLADQ